MEVPLAINDIGIRQGLMGLKGKSSTLSHKAGVGGLFCIFVYLVLMSGCSTPKSKYDKLGIPVGELASVIDEFESQCANNSDWKLESDDHKLTVYTVQDSIDGYPSMCLVLYYDGNVKNHDAVVIDEISTFGFSDPDEMQSILKGYLEAGKATVDNVLFLSECGIGLAGNIQLTSELRPSDSKYFQKLPEMFQESATMDRFHSFIEGWKLPRLEAGSILQGWTLNSEYFSGVLHHLRTETEYESLFDHLVEYDHSCDLRDLKAVKKVTTAYTKLLFPQVKSLEDLMEEDVLDFKGLYQEYCLRPAVYRRGIIRQQCHLIDKEFHKEMPEFKIKQ